MINGWTDGWKDEFSHFKKTLTYINTGGPCDGILIFFFILDRWMNECMNEGWMDVNIDQWIDRWMGG